LKRNGLENDKVSSRKSLTVSIYLASLIQEGVSVNVSKSALYGIRWAHSVIGITSPTDSELVKNVFEAGKRKLAIPRPKKRADFSRFIKAIGYILFLKNGLKRILRKKNYKNHLRSNDYEVCTAVALCISNILDVLVLENINLSSNRNRANRHCGLMMQTWISVISPLYTLSAVYISTAR
jgi:hypothetical protein